MVKQSQEHQLAMPLMRHAALLFRGRLSAGERTGGDSRALSCLRKSATSGDVASLRVHVASRCRRSWVTWLFQVAERVAAAEGAIILGLAQKGLYLMPFWRL